MTTDPALQEEQIKGAIMVILVADYPVALTEDEIEREVGERRFLIVDALRRLDSEGLIHRSDRFVFATRAAYHAGKLEYA
ncbi:MAG TPA: hypothetical protein VK506_09965 [Conexibacter sp.]|nr:hypothetical protein [Conexibacter sp.]